MFVFACTKYLRLAHKYSKLQVITTLICKLICIAYLFFKLNTQETTSYNINRHNRLCIILFQVQNTYLYPRRTQPIPEPITDDKLCNMLLLRVSKI